MPKGRTNLTGRAWNAGCSTFLGPDGKIYRRCSKCKEAKERTSEHWSPDKRSSDGMITGWCRSCINAWIRSHAREVRLAAMQHYSGAERPFCSCCGEDIYEFLALDHIDGNGNTHRATVCGTKKGGTRFFAWLSKNGYPPGFQVLCFNCNQAKGAFGECPHQRQRRERFALRKVS